MPENFLSITPLNSAWLLILPLISAAIGILCFRKSKWGAALISTLSAGVVCVLAFRLLFENSEAILDSTASVLEVFKLGSFSLKFGFLVDNLSAVMIFVVCFIGFLIHLFSIGYMKEDGSKGRFFAGLSFFMFSMTGIVLSDNLFMMFVFWELVGFSSYALIAHYADTKMAAEASKKAFIVNRVGDFGFLIGIIMCYYTFGTVNFSDLAQVFKDNPQNASTAIALLLMCGFIGKSAQFPLQVWLTDAMAGPTPVSALIHAATMVAAGVFMMARLGLIGMMTPAASAIMLIICAAMAMSAGFWALGQTDIKKTLAYSTLAHLGLMGAAIGMGFYGIAMLHLTMHAFFKAALFLVAGSVIYGCHHEQDMYKMGGLWKKMPITTIVAFLAMLSIIAIPYFAGYYSKDTIINSAYMIKDNGSVFMVSFVMILIAGLLTPLYMGRLFFSVFMGKPKSENASHAKESSIWMTLPLMILAVYSLAGAWGISFNMDWLSGKMSGLIPSFSSVFLKDSFVRQHDILSGVAGIHTFEIFVLCATLFLLAAAYFLYGRGKDLIKEKCRISYHVLEKHGWFDDIYDYYVEKVQQRFAALINILDLILIEGLCVRGFSAVVAFFGSGVKALHASTTRSYIIWMLIGILTIIIILSR